MIKPDNFYDLLKKHNIDFYTGVPDSLLKNFCAYITDNSKKSNHIIAVNEGTALGYAAGYHLSTEKIPIVYMQNSGLGNATNPLLSLVSPHIYSIPLILLIGWRGEPNVKDEPQHLHQGLITPQMLEVFDIPYIILSEDYKESKIKIEKLIKKTKNNNKPHAILVPKNVFDKYETKSIGKQTKYELSREEAIKILVDELKEHIFVSTTGMISRELFEYREEKNQDHNSDFLTVGSMGHASQIALGISLNTEKKVVCLDGDGAALMHLGGLTTIGTQKQKNFIHIILNNGAHDSVGGQPTVGDKISFVNIAKECGYRKCICVKDKVSLVNSIKNKYDFIEIKVNKGNRKNIGRPTISPKKNKENLITKLKT